jgi:transforming growth factor-beta-induced protein
LESKDLRSVIKADNLASNGVVHIIDGVLLPPAPPLKSIVDLAASTADLSTLVTALTAGKLTGALSGTGPFTVFAPTNEAFAKLPKASLKKLLDPSNIKELDALLEYHVIAGAAVHKAALKRHQNVKTLEGKSVEIRKTASGEVFVNRAKVITADVGASNGVVHIIDTVLDGGLIPPPAPSKSIVQLAAATPDLSTLVTALKAGNLIAALSGTGPFTVFAPTNEAFAKLPKATLNHLLDPKNIKELDAILEYHVISGVAVSKADLKSEQKVKTLEGQDVEIKATRGEVLVNQARVTTADVAASNGIVHIIDSVLMIPKPNIVQLAERTADLSILVSAVVAGGLSDTLSSAGKFTVFAPTNEAFKALPAGTLDALMKPENKAKLVDILTYHVLAEQVLSTQLKPFQAVKTVEGKLLHVQEWGGKVHVGPSLLSKDLKNVVKADNVASNGVVHIIDGVLLPPSETIVV